MLPYVPSEFWGKLIASTKDTTELTDVGRVLGDLTKEEVTNLPRAVYNLSQAVHNYGTKPVNYNHLPEHSVSGGWRGPSSQPPPPGGSCQDTQLSIMKKRSRLD